MSEAPPHEHIVLVWGRARGIGGTETRMAEVATVLRRRGHRITALILNSETETRLSALLREACSDVAFVGGPRPLRRYLQRTKPQAAVSFGLRASLMLRVAAVRRPSLRVIDARNGLEFSRGRLAWLVDRGSSALVDTFMCNSDSAASQMAENGFSPSKIVVNYSAVGVQWMKRAHVPRNPERVVMIGNSRPEKNQDFGLRVIAQADGPVEAVVYTDDAADLHRLWHGLSPDPIKSVSFVEGHVVSPRDLASTSVILHPSLSESLPRVLLEAQSQGVVAVASDVGDTRRIVGSRGFVVQPADFDGTLDALNQALSKSRADSWDRQSPELRTVSDYCNDLLPLCRERC